MTTHNMTKSREYLAWKRMRNACLNQNSTAYQFNGALGITICKEWISDFCLFYADMGDIPLSCNGLELIDASFPYSKSNCRWAFNKRGRKSVEKKSEKVNRRACDDIRSKCIPLILDMAHFEIIQSEAISRSNKEKKTIEPNFLIKEALKKAFPLPKEKP